MIAAMRIHKVRRIQLAASGLILTICACVGLVRPATFGAAWLVAWWVWTSLSLGAQANAMLHALTGGAWGEVSRPHWRIAAAILGWLALLLIPLLLATPALYPWAAAGWTPSSEQPAFQSLWLSIGFMTARLLVYMILLNAVTYGFWWTMQSRTASTPSVAALGLILYGFLASLLGMDLLLSLTPRWYSSGFGLVVITAQMKLGFAWGVIGAASHAQPAVRRDLGNMLMMYVLMWAYLAYSQFEIIWAENLPSEIVWYVARLQTGWWLTSVLLLTLGFFVPLILLLFRGIKENPLWLRAVAILVALMGVVETVWLILPSVPAQGTAPFWLALVMLAAMGGLLFALVPWHPHPCIHQMVDGHEHA